MSGLGPAACWLAHKRIESWSRIAKERVGAVRKSHDKGDGSKSTSTSMNMSTDSNNDSIASSEVRTICTTYKITHFSFFLLYNNSD